MLNDVQCPVWRGGAKVQVEDQIALTFSAPRDPQFCEDATGRTKRHPPGLRVAEDARFDGLYVLRTNTKLTPLQVMLRYRDLLRVEQLFRQAKAVLATRPTYHSDDIDFPDHVEPTTPLDGLENPQSRARSRYIRLMD
jgi:hypothetical protein